MIPREMKRRRGVTFIEVLVASGIFLMIIVIGYSVWSTVRRTLASAESGIDVRESALMLFSRVRAELEDALVLQTGSEGHLVLFMSPFHGGGFEFEPGPSELHQLLQGGRRDKAIRVPGLKDITFQIFPGGILRIELTLVRRSLRGQTSVEEPITFVDELYMPGLARGAPTGAAAWNSPGKRHRRAVAIESGRNRGQTREHARPASVAPGVEACQGGADRSDSGPARRAASSTDRKKLPDGQDRYLRPEPGSAPC